jgi:hypothetical protein
MAATCVRREGVVGRCDPLAAAGHFLVAPHTKKSVNKISDIDDGSFSLPAQRQFCVRPNSAAFIAAMRLRYTARERARAQREEINA